MGDGASAGVPRRQNRVLRARLRRIVIWLALAADIGWTWHTVWDLYWTVASHSRRIVDFLPLNGGGRALGISTLNLRLGTRSDGTPAWPSPSNCVVAAVRRYAQ